MGEKRIEITLTKIEADELLGLLLKDGLGRGVWSDLERKIYIEVRRQLDETD